jgi:RNA polymerase sigma-70 factor (sigma-E family)
VNSSETAVTAVPAGALTPPAAAEVLEAVFRARYAALVGVARLLVDAHAEAEEVVQEAFARTYARGPALHTTAEATAYVQRVVVNLCRDTLRHRAVVRRLPLPHAASAPGAESAVVLDEDQRAVTAAVRALPPRQRECVVLRYLLELSTAETARTLDIAEGTVKSNLSRALDALGGQLGGSR